MTIRNKIQVIRVSLVPTDYLIWMNEQLDQMIQDVRKANQDLQLLTKVEQN